MPRNPTTGVFTRVSNSFSNPVFGTLIDPTDADALFDDYDSGLTAAIPDEPTQVTGSSATISATAGSIAIVRTSPTATALTLPTVASRNGQPLPIFDWSSSISADHTITITPDAADTGGIMLNATLQIVSTSAQLASVLLYPSTTLDGWFIAP